VGAQSQDDRLSLPEDRARKRLRRERGRALPVHEAKPIDCLLSRYAFTMHHTAPLKNIDLDESYQLAGT
jgi:hypothetical protein